MNKYELQTILFPRNQYTVEIARKWLKNHGYVFTKVDITDNFLRYRQVEPKNRYKYFSTKLPNEVILVFQYPKKIKKA